MPFWVCSAAALFVTAMAFSSILHRAIRPPKPQAQPGAS
jgi:MATE family multidrug resistance protein